MAAEHLLGIRAEPVNGGPIEPLPFPGVLQRRSCAPRSRSTGCAHRSLRSRMQNFVDQVKPRRKGRATPVKAIVVAPFSGGAIPCPPGCPVSICPTEPMCHPGDEKPNPRWEWELDSCRTSTAESQASSESADLQRHDSKDSSEWSDASLPGSVGHDSQRSGEWSLPASVGSGRSSKTARRSVTSSSRSCKSVSSSLLYDF